MLKQFEIKNIYIGEYVPIYRGEYIEYKMNATDNGYLGVPKSGYSNIATVSYNWKVSVDGGAETTYSGSNQNGGSIWLSGYEPGSNHTIRITPVTESYGWAQAYGWYNTSIAGNLTEVIYDASYMGYADSETSTGTYFRTAQYYRCTALIKPVEEYLPDTVTTIGASFRSSQYFGCSGLTYSTKECLPKSVTSIGNSYRDGQYRACTSLVEIKGWDDSKSGGINFRYYQYYGCTSNKTVKVLSDVKASQDANTLINDYVTTVYVPSAYLSNFVNTSSQPRASITDSKFIGY